MINLLPKTEVINTTEKVCYPTWQTYKKHTFFGASAFVLKVFLFILLAAFLDVTGLLYATTMTKTESLTNEDDFIAIDGDLVYTDGGAYPMPSAGESVILTADDFEGGTFIDAELYLGAIKLSPITENPSDGLIFSLSFDDAVGVLTDAGEKMTAYQFLGDITKTSGVVGEAYTYDGINDAINVQFASQERIGDMTFSFWFKKPELNNSLDYILDGRPNGNWWIMNDYVGGSVCADPNGNICFYDVVEITSDKLAGNEWQHVAFSVTASTTTAYLNGVVVGTGVGYLDTRYPGTAMYLGDSLRIGSRLNNIDYYQGDLDEISIYSRALALEEIETLSRAYEHVGTYETGIIDLDGSDLFDVQLSGENTDLATIYYRICESATVCGSNYVAYNNDPVREVHFVQLNIQLNAGESDRISPVISQIEVIKSNYPDSIGVVPVAGLAFEQNQTMDSLLANAQTPGESNIRFQVSANAGNTWLWFDGDSWDEAVTDSDVNTDIQISSAIDELSVADSVFVWKAILLSDGIDAPLLENVILTYQSNEVAPEQPVSTGGGSGRSSEPDYPTNKKPTVNNTDEEDTDEEDTDEANDQAVADEVEDTGDETISAVGGGPGYAPRGQAYSPVTGEVEEITPVIAGQYIRSESFSTIYYVTDDYSRRPFWNEVTFFTWEDGFDNVLWVTDATLTVLPLYKPMMPKPETILVKIQSDPRVYWTERSDNDPLVFILRWIAKEQIAKEAFGENWADYVLDIEPTLFSNLRFGEDIEQPKELVGKTYNLARVRK